MQILCVFICIKPLIEVINSFFSYSTPMCRERQQTEFNLIVKWCGLKKEEGGHVEAKVPSNANKKHKFQKFVATRSNVNLSTRHQFFGGFTENDKQSSSSSSSVGGWWFKNSCHMLNNVFHTSCQLS